MLKGFSQLPAPVKTGISSIDKQIGGKVSNGLFVIKGDPGTGKSAFALQMCGDKNTKFLYLNTEMAEDEIFKRLASRTNRVNISQILYLGKEELEKISSQTIDYYQHLEIIEGKAGFISLEYLHDKLNELAKTGENICLIIDSFHGWAATSGKTKEQFTDEIVTKLLDFCGEFKCPIIVLNEAKLNISLEHAADTVLSFSWERQGRTDAKGNKSLSCKVSKNRNGDIGNLIIEFNGELQQFSE